MISLRTVVLLAVFTVFSNAAIAGEYKAGEVIVKYKSEITRSRIAMNTMYSHLGVAKVRRYSGMMRGFEQLVLRHGINVRAVVALLNKSPFVEYAQPNYILSINPISGLNEEESSEPAPVPAEEPPPCIIPGFPFPPGCVDDPADPSDPSPNPPATRPALQDSPADVDPPVADPNIEQAYGLKSIQAIDAWAEHRGSKNFVVAVIDTGIDYNHEDLAFNVWRNPNPTKEDIAGFDFVHNDGLPWDDQGHGTHTSGTVGAVGGNGKGVSGVSQRVSIMGVKFLTAEGTGTTADAIRSIDYAIEHGAKVLSNSWGGPADEENPILKEAIDRAKDKGVLFVAAAGNDGADNDGTSASYPAAFDNDNIIAVAAVDSGDRLPWWSNYGKKTTHVAAPGARVYSTLPGNRYGKEDGTSMACPHVAGAAALIWSKNPTWDYKKVKEVLMNTVDKIPALENKTIAGGRINVLKALSYRD